MKRLLAIIACLIVPGAALLYAGPVEDWQAYEPAVRDGTVPRIEAAARLVPLVTALDEYIGAHYDLASGTWAFPLAGYDRRALLKNDFQPHSRYGTSKITGYDFFDGNRHGGHPAYDIFIRDKDQDGRDDRTRKPVAALAMADAVVLSIHTGWEKGDPLRGGNYVWLYHPGEKKFFYYAHLQTVDVQPGARVRRGERIGTVGRTGQAAAQKRSPTHLHLMVLRREQGKLVPFDYYGSLPRPRGKERKN